MGAVEETADGQRRDDGDADDERAREVEPDEELGHWSIHPLSGRESDGDPKVAV
jgi:hypothetical protein